MLEQTAEEVIVADAGLVHQNIKRLIGLFQTTFFFQDRCQLQRRLSVGEHFFLRHPLRDQPQAAQTFFQFGFGDLCDGSRRDGCDRLFDRNRLRFRFGRHLPSVDHCGDRNRQDDAYHKDDPSDEVDHGTVSANRGSNKGETGDKLTGGHPDNHRRYPNP
jgi:hypothetical protein